MIPHVLLAVAYVFLHSMLVLLQVFERNQNMIILGNKAEFKIFRIVIVDIDNWQATTLNVAINASNKALLTIMMSNNFVELKGSVFKKFDRSNLFQVFLIF